MPAGHHGIETLRLERGVRPGAHAGVAGRCTRGVALAWVWTTDRAVLTLKEAREREYAGSDVGAEVSSRPLVDPDYERVR